jgi:DNA protecting protein DprA
MNFPILCQQALQLPSQLLNVPEPPEQLYFQGSEQALELLSQLPERGLAIVGTRSPLPRSVVQLRHWIRDLRGSGLIVISGLARGIDAVAHSAALDSGLPTIAVLGAGLEIDYPRQNQELRERILRSGGLLVSEFPPRMPAMGHQFLRRNRLVAGWSKATWVIEAGIPSGALNTARWARELDRAVFATPCSPGDPPLKGNQVLLDRDHALAYWGVHSLGAVWIELSSWGRKSESPARSPNRGRSDGYGDTGALTNEIVRLTYRNGTAHLQELMTWSHQQGWGAGRFYAALEATLQQKKVSKGVGEKGVVTFTSMA